MPHDLPYLSESDIADLLDYPSLIDLMAQVLVTYSQGHAIQPTRSMLAVEPDQRYFGLMPAVLPDAMGAKMVCFYPANARLGKHTHTATIALFDPDDGAPLAVMDGRLITEMRTAATSAAVSRVLAPANSTSLVLIGSGVQAAAHLAALRTVFPLSDIRVWSRTPAKAEAFAATHGARACGDVETAAQGADIVVTATNARDPVLRGDWLKPGCHVNAVGSPRPDWRELDDAAMANTVIVDCREAAAKEAGDVLLSGATIHGDAGEVLSGQVTVPPTATTIFKSLGIAVEDLAAARMVFDRHCARTGTPIPSQARV